MSDLQDYIDKGLIKFAEDSDILIEVCHVGSTGTFAPMLADITGCSVIAACGSSSEGARVICLPNSDFIGWVDTLYTVFQYPEADHN